MVHDYTTINSAVDYPNPAAPYLDKAFLQAILTELGNSSIDTAGDIPMTGALRQLFAGMIAQQGPLGGLGIRHYADVLSQQVGLTEWCIAFNVPLDFVTIPTPISVSSLTRVGSVATATIPGNTFSNGDMITFTGADQPEYNITAAIYGKSGSNVSYTVAGTPVTPATGTITATNVSTPWGGRDTAAPCLLLKVPEDVSGLQLWSAPTGLAGSAPVWVLVNDLAGAGKMQFNMDVATGSNATPAGTVLKTIVVGKAGALTSSVFYTPNPSGSGSWGLYKNGVLVGATYAPGGVARTVSDTTTGWVVGDTAEIRVIAGPISGSFTVAQWVMS